MSKILNTDFQVRVKMAAEPEIAKVKALTKAKLNLAKKTQRLVTPDGTIEIIPSLGKVWAELLLSNMPRNRRLKKYHMSKIVRAMDEGRFMWTGDTIRILQRPKEAFILIDGQHRLSGVIVTGIPIKNAILITLNDPNVVKIIDTAHTSRSVGDIEEMMGDRRTSAAVVAAIKLELGGFDLKVHRQLAKDEVYDLVRGYDLLDEAIVLYKAGQRAGGAKVTSGPVAGALACLRANPAIKDYVLQFFLCAFENDHRVYFGGGEDEFRYESSVKALANWLISIRLKQDRTRNETTGESYKLASAEIAIRAWNAWTIGNEVKKLQRGKTGKMPLAKSGFRRLQAIKKTHREAKEVK